MKKTYMFQYAYDQGYHGPGLSFSSFKIVEDTGLLTEAEALALWDKYLPDFIRKLEADERPGMCIWMNCENESDYRDVLKEMEWRDDLEVVDGKIYKKTLTLMS